MQQPLVTQSTPQASSALTPRSAAKVLRAINVVAGASAGYIMLFDATAEPSAGTVSPKRCWTIAANGSFEKEFVEGLRLTNRATISFSTTGPFTYKPRATACISAEVEYWGAATAASARARTRPAGSPTIRVRPRLSARRPRLSCRSRP